jgi:hypothetical protein
MCFMVKGCHVFVRDGIKAAKSQPKCHVKINKT